ncbi:hypothetical protein MLD38_028195 [Melastoma candidum]|uniref:Uncharacterized protein n=1 Tax=Melastoma candidum TaxID=119954 RepID=A0ACB9N0V5_9MYRT|nr:hypothetical protein MLD38_028195 [Melastoma candidum]
MEGCDNGFIDHRGVLDATALDPPPNYDSVIDNPLDVNDGSVFYGDFHLQEFPCMSSSSSSSSTPAPAKPSGSSPTSSSASLVAVTASSSSATSWALLGRDVVGVEERENGVLVQVGDCSAHEQLDALVSTASMEIILEKPTDEDAVVAGAVEGNGSSAADAAMMGSVDACMDVMENFGYMELLEGDDMFDPTSLFQSENLFDQEVHHMGCFGEDHATQEYPHEIIKQHEENEAVLVADTRCDEVAGAEVGDDMGAVFLEWLRANRDSISVEDLRKVKIKKSTIEMAARRLGGGKEAMKQLLKLILEWVQTNHLPRKYAVESSSTYPDFVQPNQNPSFTAAQPGSTMFADPNTSDSCFAPQWAPPPTLFTQPGMDPGLAGAGTYMGSEPKEFPMVDLANSWPPAVQWPQYEYMENFQPALGSPHGFGSGGCGFGYPGQYPLPYFSSSSSSSTHMKFARLGSSATKEARKKRMARQRRLSHHHHHQRVGTSHRQDTGQRNVAVEQQTAEMIGSENYSNVVAGRVDGNANWMYWPPAMQGGMPASEPLQVQQPEVLPVPHPPPPLQSYQQQIPAQQPDRRQTWKPESNLKFLLQKVLKQSDVGNLGRIVLPKKEAETHLPELEARDGISIAMEDIGTSRVWNMRYRFWPNNKSRMYLLENTGDFVRANGLEEGDFIVIYSDVKCGKYLIRGVKVRQPEGTTKAATKRTDKAQIRSNSNGNGNAGIEKEAPSTGTNANADGLDDKKNYVSYGGLGGSSGVSGAPGTAGFQLYRGIVGGGGVNGFPLTGTSAALAG